MYRPTKATALTAAAATLLAFSAIATAAPLSFQISGTFQSNGSTEPAGAALVGKSFTGTLTFDLSPADLAAAPSPNTRTNVVSSLSLAVDGAPAVTITGTATNSVIITNNLSTYDEFALTLSDGAPGYRAILDFTGPPTTFSSAAFPTSLPSAGWYFYLGIPGTGSAGASTGNATLTALVPEPTTLLAAAPLLTLTATQRRRRRRA